MSRSVGNGGRLRHHKSHESLLLINLYTYYLLYYTAITIQVARDATHGPWYDA